MRSEIFGKAETYVIYIYSYIWSLTSEQLRYYARTKPNTFNGRVLKTDAPRESSYMHDIVNATMETGCSVLSFADNEMYPYSIVGHNRYRAIHIPRMEKHVCSCTDLCTCGNLRFFLSFIFPHLYSCCWCLGAWIGSKRMRKKVRNRLNTDFPIP